MLRRRTRAGEPTTVVPLPGTRPPPRGRRTKLWIVALAAAVLAGFGVGVWTVQEVRVVDASSVSPDEILAASGLEGGERLALTRLARVRERVERLPGIRSARVERAFPARVAITVSERVPVARLDARPELVVDAEGVMFTVPGDPPLPAVAGWEGRAAPGREVDSRTRHVLAAYAEFPQSLRSRTVMLRGGERFELVLAEGVEVRFGEPRELVAKAFAAEAVFDVAAQRGTPLEYIDVRVPSTPVVGELEPPSAPNDDVPE